MTLDVCCVPIDQCHSEMEDSGHMTGLESNSSGNFKDLRLRKKDFLFLKNDIFALFMSEIFTLK